MDLKDSILKTIAYFDLFDFPLTAEEIKEYLYNYKKPLHIKEIKGTLRQMVEDDEIEELRDYFVLKGRGKIVETRKTRKFIAEKLWNRTKLYGQYMRSVPFVRMIAVCNNLAYDNPSQQSDIDLFIVIKPGADVAGPFFHHDHPSILWGSPLWKQSHRQILSEFLRYDK